VRPDGPRFSCEGDPIKAELAQLALVDGNLEHNTDKVLESIRRANVVGGTKLVVFPETTLSGFPTRENLAAVAQPIDSPALVAVREAARRAGVAVAVGLAERDGTRYFNTTLLIDASGHIIQRYRKTHLWASDEGIFTPGDRFEVCTWQGLSVGVLICYDIEFPETARALGRLGAELLIVTNGNMDPYGPVHRRAIAARAMENQVYVVMANRCGRGDQQLTFPGQSALVDPSGEIVRSAESEETQLAVELDLSRIAASRKNYQYLREARVALTLRPAEQATNSRALIIESPDSVDAPALPRP
jgi:(R)-amidase